MDATAPQVFKFGDFVLDIGHRSLTRRGGRALPLRPKVFETLIYLVRHHGQALTKQEIMRGVWGHEFIEENNLNQHISTLRDVLGDTRGNPHYIATLPRHGYCFVADVGVDLLTGADNPVRTLAILPFESLDASQCDSALEFGMADALIRRLSALPEMIVRPLASVRQYASTAGDPRQIGGELGVDAILSGTIGRSGTQVRIGIRLLHCASGRQLWAETFDEPWTELFAVEDRISQRVATAVAPHLAAASKSELARRPTTNLEAYELYLRGCYHAGKVSPEGINTALGFFQQAIERDPDFALAHVGLADIWRMLPIARDVPPHDVFPKAKEAIAAALCIDPMCAEAHTLSGFIGLWYDWDWEASERSLRTAIAINPGHAEARLGYAHLLSHLGRHDEALSQVEQARGLDPFSLRINALEGMFLFYAGRIDAAYTRLHRALELESGFWVANVQLAKVQITRGEIVATERSLAIAGQGSGGNSEVPSLLAYARGVAGDIAGGNAALHELEARARLRYVPPYNLAIAYLGLGRVDDAFACLESAKDDRDVRLTSIRVEPKWNTVRGDARFGKIVRDLRLD